MHPFLPLTKEDEEKIDDIISMMLYFGSSHHYKFIQSLNRNYMCDEFGSFSDSGNGYAVAPTSAIIGAFYEDLRSKTLNNLVSESARTKVPNFAKILMLHFNLKNLAR